MAAPYTIGELAEAAEIAVSTVRYYERVKLLRPSGRTGSNYRYYGQPELERLLFIRAAHAAGFTLSDISTLLELRDGSLEPCAEVQALIENRLDEIAGRMAEFRRVQRELKSALALCRAACRPSTCEVLDQLSAARPPGKAKR